MLAHRCRTFTVKKKKKSVGACISQAVVSWNTTVNGCLCVRTQLRIVQGGLTLSCPQSHPLHFSLVFESSLWKNDATTSC